MQADPRYSAKLLMCLAAVYIIWGSTFMATKVAATHLPVALFSALRFLTAGSVLAMVARFGLRHPFPRRLIDWRHVIVTGFFMVFAANGLNAWALQFLPSSQSALLNGTAAFWIAGLGVFGRRGHPLSRGTVVGLGIGFAGTALTMVPRGALHGASLLAQLGVLGASLAFSLGTLYYRSAETQVESLMFMAMQLFCGGVLLLVLALLHGDVARWTFNEPGLIAVGYLTFVSSCLAFTAYGWLTRNAAPAVIGTYSYVNPAIATFLGWEFLNESMSHLQLVGMLVIIVGVSILTLPGGSFSDPKTLDEPKAA
jgi:drug/metabolite transporter (DMT)-like permease